MKTVLLIAGTRPEVIKMLPLYLELKQREGLSPSILLTGQHRELADDLLELFGITQEPAREVMVPGQSLATLASRLAQSISSHLNDHKPDGILVQGDTTSAMMGGILGFYEGIPVGHVEAGLRTGNLHAPFPEEFNRRVLSMATRWHFAPTKAAVANLAEEGITQDVHCVGNTVVDAALMIADKQTERVVRLRNEFPFLNGPVKKTVLVTVHRRESFGEGIQGIALAIQELATLRSDLHFILPVHPNPAIKPVLASMLRDIPNIHLTDPFAYDEMLCVIRSSAVILTDSGGIQEEAPIFGVPLLVLRNETERLEGIEAGCSLLVGSAPNAIVEAFTRLMTNPDAYQQMASVQNPYGDGQSSRRIADILSASLRPASQGTSNSTAEH